MGHFMEDNLTIFSVYSIIHRGGLKIYTRGLNAYYSYIKSLDNILNGSGRNARRWSCTDNVASSGPLMPWSTRDMIDTARLEPLDGAIGCSVSLSRLLFDICCNPLTHNSKPTIGELKRSSWYMGNVLSLWNWWFLGISFLIYF